jgi:predicted CXXCH cytochrome family protein
MCIYLHSSAEKFFLAAGHAADPFGSRPRRSRAWRRLAAALLTAALLAVVASGQNEGRILRPVDGDALSTETADIIATAPAGHLELDGKPIDAEQPFPNVFHARIKTSAGEHRLALVWEGGRNEIRFFTGGNPPAEFKAFQQHPPLEAVECTQCHGVSRRGRFRFEGGCFACHAEDNFTKTHPHAVHVLQECGLCHNAHGSTEKGHLLYPKEKACKLCHG